MNSTLKVSGIVIFGVLISIVTPRLFVMGINKNLEGNKTVKSESKTTNQETNVNNAIVMNEKRDTAVPVKAEPEEKKEEPVEEVKEEAKQEETKKEEIKEEVKKEEVLEAAPAPAKAYNDMTNEELIAAIANGSFKLEYSASYETNTKRLTKSRGALYYNNHKETYYSQRVLPGTSLRIPGRHVADDGTVRDGDGYICVAASTSYLSRGAVVKTSLGPAKVYDSGCASGTIDIYTNW